MRVMSQSKWADFSANGKIISLRLLHRTALINVCMYLHKVAKRALHLFTSELRTFSMLYNHAHYAL